MASAVIDKYLTVLMGNQNETNAGAFIRNGDRVDITASGTVWSGAFAAGINGPDGWQGWRASGAAVLEGVPPFSLLWRTAEDGYMYVGSSYRRTYESAAPDSGETELTFMINHDPSERMGNGSFLVHLVVWR